MMTKWIQYLILDTNISQEASYFTQQVGAFEVQEYKSKNSKILQQMVIDAPIYWCPLIQSQPITVIGNYNW